jgi:hypothetical protein
MALFARRVIRALSPVCLILPAVLSAQVRASERATVSQTIDGTVITVDYARPRVRGRDTLFGGEVKWKEIWTPGANWATTLEVNRDVSLEGHPVPKGKYSVWMRVEPELWTVILDPKWHRFHMNRPDSSDTQIRFPIRPGEGPFTEALTWSVPDVKINGTTLVLAWGTVRVALAISVEPSHPLTMTREAARPFLGTYRFRWAEDGDSAKPSRFTVSYENEMLMVRWVPAPWPEVSNFPLIRIADGWFNIATLKDGELYDVMDEMVLEFSPTSGQAKGFEVRGDKDKLEATAEREH